MKSLCLLKFPEKNNTQEQKYPDFSNQNLCSVWILRVKKKKKKTQTNKNKN